jgi:hypothetical protein
MNGKEAYYFPHDANARNDLKISAMLSKYGVAGYGMYWMIVEVLRESKNFEAEHKKYTYSALAKQMSCTDEQVEAFISDCINAFELFQSNERTFWSESLKRRMEIKNEIAEKRRFAAISRWGNTNAKQKQCKIMPLKERKGKERKEKEKEKIEESLPHTAQVKAEKLKAKIDKKVSELNSTWRENVGLYVAKYPGLDHELERQKMEAWMRDFPGKALKRSNLNLFCHSWLGRAKPNFNRGPQKAAPTKPDYSTWEEVSQPEGK